MIQEFKSHKVAYSVLLIVVLVFALSFLHAWPNRTMQKMISISMGVFYFLWGIVVHVKSDHISTKIVFEYFAMALLSVCLLLLLLN